MATEEKIILSADVTKAAESVAELKEQIKTLRDTIQDEATSVEESAAAAELLKAKQQALRGIMAGSAEAFKNAQDTSEGMTKSYNTLVTEMAKLKAEWRASTDTMERVELGKKINEINDQLKNLDASTGNFQRNVGDYANKMSKAFQMTAGSAGSVVNPLNNVKGAMMAVSSTPLIAILGLLANIIMTVIQNLKKSEEGMNALSEAFAAFQVVGDLVTKVLEGIGWVLTKVIGWIGDMTAAIIGNNEAMQEKLRLHELEKQALETERENIKLNAEAERDISELRAKAADKVKYSAQERIDMLKKAGDLEAEISKRNLELARQEYEAWQLRNEPTKSSEENLKAEAEAYAKMLQAETAYNNKQRKLTAQITEARKQMIAENEKLHAEQMRPLNEALAEADRAISQIKKNGNVEVKLEMPDWSEPIEEANNYAEALKAVKDAQLMTGTDEEREAQELLELQMGYQTRLEMAMQFGLDTEAITREYEQRKFDIEEGYRQKRELAEKKEIENDKKLQKQRVNNMAAVIGAMGNLMGTLAGIYESDTDASEDELRKAKNLKIAGAIMSTIEGAIGAFMNASKAYDPPYGQIIGAISAATVTAAGIAQVRQLQSQEVNKNASGATTISPNSIPLPSSEGATAQAPTMEPVIESVRTITTASEEEQMNQSQKVYLVTDELEMMQKSKRVRMAETTF